MRLTYKAFQIADAWRTLVIVLSDAYIGQMMEPVELPTEVKHGTRKDWALYGDKESRKNLVTSIFMNQKIMWDVNENLQKKYQKMEEELVEYEEIETDDADVIFIAFGITARVCLTAMKEIRKKGIKIGLFRPKTLFPFPKARIQELSKSTKKFIVAELNNGQMAKDVELAIQSKIPVLRYNWYGGTVPSIEEIIERTENDLAGS